MVGKNLEQFGEVKMVDEMNGYGLGFFKKTESGFWSTTIWQKDKMSSIVPKLQTKFINSTYMEK